MTKIDLPGADAPTLNVLQKMADAGLPPMHEQGVEQARAAMWAGAANDLDPAELGKCTDTTFAGPGGDVAVRCYYPPNKAEGNLPSLIYFHGGGFVIGDLDTHDNICRALCVQAECVVINVDYRLAPEHQYPAAVDDALASLDWALANTDELGIDPLLISTGGDSAGGLLAAVVAQKARDRGVTLLSQLLFYPVVDLSSTYPSHITHAKTPPISKPVLEWFWTLYMGEDGMQDPGKLQEVTASPILAASFEDLAPAFVLTAGLDPLHDEGRMYAERLIASGVETTYMCAMGTIHGFLRFGKLLPSSSDALGAASSFLANRVKFARN